MSKLFTQREVNKIFGHIPPQTLRWWGLVGLYQCAEEVHDRRGTSRLFSLDNLYQIGIVEELSPLNIPTAYFADGMEKSFNVSGIEAPKKMRGRDNGESADGESTKKLPGLDNSIMDKTMEHILIIAKRLTKLRAGRPARPVHTWHFRLMQSIDDASFNSMETILILVDLKKIKKKIVDLIKEAFPEG